MKLPCMKGIYTVNRLRVILISIRQGAACKRKYHDKYDTLQVGKACHKYIQASTRLQQLHNQLSWAQIRMLSDAYDKAEASIRKLNDSM